MQKNYVQEIFLEQHGSAQNVENRYLGVQNLSLEHLESVQTLLLAITCGSNHKIK